MQFNFKSTLLKLLKVQVEWALKNIPQLNDYQLTPQNWLVFDEVVRLLDPLEQVTRYLCGDKYPTLCLVIPSMRASVDFIKEKLQLQTREAQVLRDNLLESIAKEFPAIEVNETLSIATLLNPCYKKAGFSMDSFADLAIERTIQALHKQENEAPSDLNRVREEPEECQPKRGGFDLHAQVDKDVNSRAKVSTCTTSVEVELAVYLGDDPESNRKIDIFLWWYSRKTQFPRLFALAESYLIIPASSASSERVFSAAGNLVDKKRNRMGSKNLNILLNLKFYYMFLFSIFTLFLFAMT
jgi:hypothetical protein